MIEFIDLSQEKPYQVFKDSYEHALENKQSAIDAISISSYNPELSEVESRFVNLKYIVNDEWIFFSNYASAKSKSFKMHPQISAVIYWKKPIHKFALKQKSLKQPKNFQINTLNRDQLKKMHLR